MNSPFTPCYIFENELAKYGLPTPDEVPDIMNAVQLASTMIDEACGRFDGDGSGSLVYTTYTQRILLQTRNRNLVMLTEKPVVPVDTATVASLQSLAASGENFYDTGVIANTLKGFSTPLSGILSASGRYGYTRQDMSIAYPDLFSFINPLNLLTMFGGPAPWVPIDVTMIDYDVRTGECWIPAGLQLQRYSEILISYNSGFDPRSMHRVIKNVCASLTKNILPRGGTTGLANISLSRSGANIGFDKGGVLDATLDQMLTPFKTVRAY